MCALLCSPFSAVKMGGPFSLRCLSPLCSAAVGAGRTQMAVLGMLRCGLDGFAAQKNRLVFLTRLAMHILGPCQLGCFDVDWIFLQHKRPAWFHIHAGLYCEPEGLSPEGVLSYPTSTKPHRTREPRGLSPSGGSFTAKLHVSLRPCAPQARSPGCRGTTPA